MSCKIMFFMFTFFPTSLERLLFPFRLSKTLLENVWNAFNLLSGVASMFLGALGPLLGCSWLALASLLLAFELVWLA